MQGAFPSLARPDTKAPKAQRRSGKRAIATCSYMVHRVSFGVRPVYPKLRKEGKGRSAQYER